MFQIRQDQLNALQTRSHANTPVRLLESLVASGAVAEQETATGDVLVSDKRGYKARIQFHANGLMREIRSPSGRRQRFEHDSQGRVSSVDFWGAARWKYGYGAHGLVDRFEIVGHGEYRFDYDARGLLEKVHHPDGRYEAFDRDLDGALIRHIQRSGATSHRTSNATEDVRIDPAGRVTAYRRDESGMLDRVELPDGTHEEYLVDPDASRIVITQRSGQLIDCRTDDEGRPTAIAWEDGGELELAYADEGRLAGVKNPVDEIQFIYDDQGRVLQEISKAGALVHQYDPDGRLASLVTHHGDEIRYGYDEDGRVNSIYDWEGRRIAVDYSADGSLTSFVFPNGVVESQRGSGEPFELARTLVGRKGQLLSRQSCQFNQNDRVARIRDEWNVDDQVEQFVRGIEYDPDFRVAGERDLNSDEVLSSYEYDIAGNLVRDNGSIVAFGEMDNPVSRPEGPISYDGLGNIVRYKSRKGDVHLSFSADSRLKSADLNGNVYRYAYDGLCRRTAKTDGMAAWRYGWSGFQLVWEEYRSSPEAEPQRRDYLYLPDCVVPIAFREKGQTYWLQSDHRGAVIAVHNQAGQIVWRGIYDSFGRVAPVINEVRQPWRLSGQYYDEETGLHYNVVRYYSPDLKTYLSLDPHWQEADGSKYSYGGNDPWNRADPIGMLAPLAIGALAIGTILGAGVISGAIEAYNAPDGQKTSAFWNAAKVGAGAAAVGVAAVLLAPKIAATVVGLMAIGALEGAVGSVLHDFVNGQPICIDCMIASAGFGAALGFILPGVGGFLGRQASKYLGPKLAPLLSKILKKGKAPKPIRFPGSDPTKAPKGFKWRGKPGSRPGSKDGNYFNEKTGESIRPDLDHPEPIGPHWDYKDPDGKWWRVFSDGRKEPK